MEILDARGLSCPEPVIMLSKAMMSKENKYQMIVDSPTAKENVSNYGKKQGYNVNITEQNGEYTLTFTKYSLQGTTQGRYLTGGVPPVRFSM